MVRWLLVLAALWLTCCRPTPLPPVPDADAAPASFVDAQLFEAQAQDTSDCGRACAWLVADPPNGAGCPQLVSCVRTLQLVESHRYKVDPTIPATAPDNSLKCRALLGTHSPADVRAHGWDCVTP